VEAEPYLVQDRRTLYFDALNRVAGLGIWDVWMATRTDPDGPFTSITTSVLASTRQKPRPATRCAPMAWLRT
jgi:hypothetical protein